METAAYQQTREAIDKMRASIGSLEEHFERFHGSGKSEDLGHAQVKVQDLFAQLGVLQKCLNRFDDRQSA
jgi:hypothetical protein